MVVLARQLAYRSGPFLGGSTWSGTLFIYFSWSEENILAWRGRGKVDLNKAHHFTPESWIGYTFARCDCFSMFCSCASFIELYLCTGPVFFGSCGQPVLSSWLTTDQSFLSPSITTTTTRWKTQINRYQRQQCTEHDFWHLNSDCNIHADVVRYHDAVVSDNTSGQFESRTSCRDASST